jgi:hypothetical protein
MAYCVVEVKSKTEGGDKVFRLILSSVSTPDPGMNKRLRQLLLRIPEDIAKGHRHACRVAEDKSQPLPPPPFLPVTAIERINACQSIDWASVGLDLVDIVDITDGAAPMRLSDDDLRQV